MVILRELIEITKPNQPILYTHYNKWRSDVKQRCQKQNLPYPPFAVIDRYHEARGSNGIVVAIHHSNNDAMVHKQTGLAGTSLNDLQPVDIDSYRNWLASKRWDLFNVTIMFFPIDKEASFEPLWKQYLEMVEQRKKILDALKSEDVVYHLEEARRLLRGKTRVDWGNAKAQARKALESLAISVTGKSTLKGLGKELISRNLLGERETVWIDRFDSLLGATYGLGSKKGGHKPDPSYIEAKFYIDISTALVNYVVALLLS